MELLTAIQLEKTKHSRIEEVDFNQLEFGKYVSDHMLVCDYDRGEWQPAAIKPFGNLTLSPTALALHYGQTVFEGLKAFRMHDGRINIFRLDRHYERFVKSLERLCMAVPPREIFIDGLLQLVALDKAWIPAKPGAALYLRPFMYASEGRFGIKIAEEYKFVVFTGPVPELYAKPIKVKVETHYTRAAKGGTGFAKCGGNYAAAFLPTRQAREEGYEQVLWTDGVHNSFIEESGMMNVFFVIDGILTTAPLSDSILDGVTRDSLLQLATELDYPIAQRQISVDELKQAFKDRTITEAFGAGTAAVVAPIDTIRIHDTDYSLPGYDGSSIHQLLKKGLQDRRLGLAPDTNGWNFII